MGLMSPCEKHLPPGRGLNYRWSRGVYPCVCAGWGGPGWGISTVLGFCLGESSEGSGQDEVMALRGSELLHDGAGLRLFICDMGVTRESASWDRQLSDSMVWQGGPWQCWLFPLCQLCPWSPSPVRWNFLESAFWAVTPTAWAEEALEASLPGCLLWL